MSDDVLSLCRFKTGAVAMQAMQAMQLSLYFAWRQGLHPRFATAGSPILPIDDLRHRVNPSSNKCQTSVKQVSNKCQTSVMSELVCQVCRSRLCWAFSAPSKVEIESIFDWYLENSWDLFDNLIIWWLFDDVNCLVNCLKPWAFSASNCRWGLSTLFDPTPNVRSLERWTTKQRRNERNTQKNSKEFQHIPRYSKWASLSLRNHKPSSSVVQHKRVDLRTIAWIILIYIYTYPPMQWIGYHVQIMVFNQIIGIRFCLKSGSLSSQGFESCKYDGMECQLCTSQLAWFNRFKQLQLKKKQIQSSSEVWK